MGVQHGRHQVLDSRRHQLRLHCLTPVIIMLSRLAVRSAMVPRCLAGARELATTPALAERDLVNFPPRQRPIERGPVKALIFPAEWFDALYPKTGVTGPYMALFGVSTFLASKEYFVMEHDFYVGMGLAIVMTYLIKTQGPAYTEAINKQLDEEEAALKAIRQDEIDACLAQIKGEQAVQKQACCCPLCCQEEAGLPGGDRQCAEAHGAEAHGRLDHRQREGLHHPRPGGCRPQEMHF